MTGKNLIFIIGPTGCGKSTNAQKLAEHFGCKHVIDDWSAHKIARHLNAAGEGEKFLVVSSLTAGVIRLAFADASIHNFFDAMREARLVVAPQWRLDVEATRAVNQKEFAAIPNGPTLAVLGEIQGERARQVAKGFDASSDDRYTDDELIDAALAYACQAAGGHAMAANFYPWDFFTFKNEGRRADLVKAAALLVAEIERLDRAAKVGVIFDEQNLPTLKTSEQLCLKAPAGYQCTRLAGHDGPCAAVDNNTAGEP